MKDTVCITPGCWTKIKAHERYCLACRLDMGIETGQRRKTGRPWMRLPPAGPRGRGVKYRTIVG